MKSKAYRALAVNQIHLDRLLQQRHQALVHAGLDVGKDYILCVLRWHGHVFGLPGSARLGRVSVLWPNGTEQHWEGLPVDRYYRLIQGEREAKTIDGSSPK